MKKILSLVFAAMLCFAMVSTAFAAEFPFTDVSTSAWYYGDVKTAYEDKLINGKTETTFAPDLNITYVEAIKLAACMNQLYNEGEVTLTVGNPWYAPYVEYCIEEGIIAEKHGLDFNAPATREGYMEIFANALPDKALKEVNYVPDGSIPDVPDNDAIYKMYRAGIVGGVDAKRNCNPKANIKRSEVAAVLTRMMNEDKRVTFEMPGAEKPEEVVVPLAIKTQPALTTVVKTNETAKLTVEVEGGKAPYTYQWQVGRMNGKQKTFGNLSDRENISGSATAEVSLTAAEANQSEFRCVITDANGDTVTTRTVIVKFEVAEVTTEPSGGGVKDKYEQGDSVELTKEAFTMTIDDSFVVTGRGIVITGYVADGKLEKGDTIYINDADGKFVVETKAVNIEMFHKLIDECKKGDTAGLQLDLDVETWRNKLERGYVASATKGTTVGTRPSTGVTRPPVPTRPTTEKVFYADLTAMVSPNDSGKIAYVANVFNGSGDYSYRWERSIDGGAWDASSYKTNTLELDARGKGDSRCKITDNVTGEVIYTPAIAPNMVAKYGPFVAVKNDTVKAVYIHPTNIDTYNGMNAMRTGKSYELKAVVIGGTAPYTYQWYYAENNSDAFEAIGTNESSIKLTPSKDITTFKCVITDANGNTVTSEKFNVIVIIDLSGN